MNTKLVALFFIALAVVMDVLANICIKKSCGLKNKKYAVFSVLLIIGFCFSITEAIRRMDLSIAYAMFGALGLISTTIVDKLLFGLRIGGLGIAGMISVVGGIVMMKLA